eukprot:TRINITY_DN14779_c0_g1_i4.p1 TRINITY_DN14779_c0_g1~~TRINITY_DN14779_c0_g1_i4.p1  ORF type:complete len:555 (-),score=74.36 TRINITY_DN14779_c0_g1_i4:417-2081(-)
MRNFQSFQGQQGQKSDKIQFLKESIQKQLFQQKQKLLRLKQGEDVEKRQTVIAKIRKLKSLVNDLKKKQFDYRMMMRARKFRFYDKKQIMKKIKRLERKPKKKWTEEDNMSYQEALVQLEYIKRYPVNVKYIPLTKTLEDETQEMRQLQLKMLSEARQSLTLKENGQNSQMNTDENKYRDLFRQAKYTAKQAKNISEKGQQDDVGQGKDDETGSVSQGNQEEDHQEDIEQLTGEDAFCPSPSDIKQHSLKEKEANQFNLKGIARNEEGLEKNTDDFDEDELEKSKDDFDDDFFLPAKKNKLDSIQTKKEASKHNQPDAGSINNDQQKNTLKKKQKFATGVDENDGNELVDNDFDDPFFASSSGKDSNRNDRTDQVNQKYKDTSRQNDNLNKNKKRKRFEENQQQHNGKAQHRERTQKYNQNTFAWKKNQNQKQFNDFEHNKKGRFGQQYQNKRSDQYKQGRNKQSNLNDSGRDYNQSQKVQQQGWKKQSRLETGGSERDSLKKVQKQRQWQQLQNTNQFWEQSKAAKVSEQEETKRRTRAEGGRKRRKKKKSDE